LKDRNSALIGFHDELYSWSNSLMHPVQNIESPSPHAARRTRGTPDVNHVTRESRDECIVFVDPGKSFTFFAN
jgi:hypothetical protein